jgi:valyl-tRNA synthetase
MITPWPESRSEHRDAAAEKRFGFTEEVVSEVRRFRKTHGLKDSALLAVRILPTEEQREIIDAARPEIQRLAAISSLEVLDAAPDPTGSARLVAEGAQLLIPLAGVLDLELERARLSKRLSEIDADAARIEGKLANEAFLQRAPSEVVEKERAKLSALKEEAATVSAQLGELG